MKVTIEDLKKSFKNIMPDALLDKLDPAKPLVDQGVDSLALTAMAVALQNIYKVTLSVEDTVKLKSLNDVVAYLKKA